MNGSVLSSNPGVKPILIVGSGPAGMILANELLRRNVPIRLIDKRGKPSVTSRAITIHARSMEMFDHMGIAFRLKEICLECPGNIYHFPGVDAENCPRTDYRVLPTRFPFYYKISQNDFEQVLREHLFAHHSIIPEYSTELLDVKQIDEVSIEAILRLPNGATESRTYSYAVGCDGVRSLVRERAGIKFHGEVVAGMAMMDVELHHVNFDDRWMNYFFNNDLFMNCTKMPGNLWRIYMSEPTGEFVYAKDKRKAFQEVADRLGIGFHVCEPEWATSWDIRHMIAERYRNRRLLICGDASHVHSPTGGQGMNGCMQDAFNLGWKLAAAFQGQADDVILDTYEMERKPIGEMISEGAMATHHINMGFGVDTNERLKLTQIPDWERNTIYLVSGLSHNYMKTIVLPPGLTPVKGPAAGTRPPDCLLVKSPQKYLYDVLRRPQFTLLLCPGSKQQEVHIDLGRKVRDILKEEYPQHITTVLVQNQPHLDFDFDHWVKDMYGELAKAYEVGDEGRLILVRPDLYIGLTCIPEDWRSLPTYMSQWFLSNQAS